MPKPKYRRGFKKEAEETADGFRAEMGFHAADPLSMEALAQYLHIPVVPLTDLSHDQPGAVNYLTNTDPSVFSAVTVFAGHKRMIVHNDSHSDGRRSSNLAHELAHGILLHEPKPALDERGCRYWDQTIEDEATWLGGALLVPRPAALKVAVDEWRVPIDDAAATYGVSVEMMNFRLNATGARAQARRRQNN